MATSGTAVWQLTRNQLIEAALRKIGVIGEGVTANATQLTEGAEALNTLISEYNTLGMPLWATTEIEVPLVAGQSVYVIGEGLAINQPYPYKLHQANLNIPGNSSRINMEIKAHYDYNNLPINSSGTPVAVSYQPFIDYGHLSVWPTPSSSMVSGTSVYLLYQRPFDVFTSSGETPDFPSEWKNSLIYGLALLLADEYGLPIPDKQWLEKQAEKHLNTALSGATEEVSLFFYPNREG